jgi:hypothetical protein
LFGQSEEANVLEATVVQVYGLALTAAAHTIKLRAKKEEGDATVKAAGTAFSYELIAS